MWQAAVPDAQRAAPATQPGAPRVTLEDTYPPAAGILLQKLSEFCQKDVSRSFTLQGRGKQGCAELRVLRLTLRPPDHIPAWLSGVSVQNSIPPSHGAPQASRVTYPIVVFIVQQ